MVLMSLGGPLGAVPSLELQATATSSITGANVFIGQISGGFSMDMHNTCEDPGGAEAFTQRSTCQRRILLPRDKSSPLT
jgi:hypothetical protein